jgi:hypothetical protein
MDLTKEKSLRRKFMGRFILSQYNNWAYYGGNREHTVCKMGSEVGDYL